MMTNAIPPKVLNRLNELKTIPDTSIYGLFTECGISITKIREYFKKNPEKRILITLNPIVGNDSTTISFDGKAEDILGRASLSAVLEEICPCKLDNGQIAIATTTTLANGSIHTDISVVRDNGTYQCKPAIIYRDLSLISLIQRIIQLTNWKHLGQLDGIDQIDKCIARCKNDTGYGLDVINLVEFMQLELWLQNYVINHPNWLATTPIDFREHYRNDVITARIAYWVMDHIIKTKNKHTRFISQYIITSSLYGITSKQLLTELIPSNQDIFMDQFLNGDLVPQNPVIDD